MALDKSTGSPASAQQRLRSTTNYSAPSGPYAHSPYGPGPMQSIGGVPQYYNPQDIYNPMNRIQPSQLPAADMATKFMAGFAGSGIGMFQPSTYANMPGNLNQIRKHPGEALHQMLNTPEGLGGLAFAGLTAPVGGAAFGGAKGAAAAGEAAAIPKAVSWAPGARAALDAKYGAPMEATTRAAMLEQAPSMAEILAEKTMQMDRIQKAMKFDNGKASTKGQSSARGASHTFKPGPNPMEGKYFNYTGRDTPIDPAEHLALMEERLGRMHHDDPQFNNAYDDYLDEGGALDTGAYGLPERAQNIRNIKDNKGNVMGTLTYNHMGDHIKADEAYLRPEARGNMKYFNDLIKPLKESGLPIDAMFANEKWAQMMLRLHNKGRVKLTDEAAARAKLGGEGIGFPNSSGKYGYETPIEQLPAMGDFRPANLNYLINRRK